MAQKLLKTPSNVETLPAGVHRRDRVWISLTAALVVVMVVLLAALAAAGFMFANQLQASSSDALTPDILLSLVESNVVQLRVIAVGLFGSILALGLILLRLRQVLADHEQSRTELSQTRADLEAQLKRRTTELAEERTHTTTILQGMTEGVMVLEQGRVRYINRAFTKLTGYTNEELAGKKLLASSIEPLERQLMNLAATVTEAIAQGGIWQGPFKLHTKDGDEVDAGVIGMPLLLSSKTTQSIMLILRDRSQEKQFEDRRTSFISNVAHELRHPLSTLRTRIYLLQRKPEMLREHLPVLDEMASQMQSIMNEMLDIGLIEDGAVRLEREDAHLQDLVKEAMDGFQPKAERRSITLVSSLAEDSIPVLVDHKRLIQVISSLLSNAANHTQKNGRIEVDLTLDKSNRQRPARIQVKDNGQGIAPERLKYIFEPFHTASKGLVSGTVLGLTIAKEIVEMHGGEITAESEISKGTTFIVRLPIIEA
jgi:PAS domain S-box-containing protein